MRYYLKPSALAVKTILLSAVSCSAVVHADNALIAIDDIEVITISNQRHNSLEANQSIAQGKTTEADLANWLASVPGANVNRNGPITGIAQYRGLFGDRIAISLDGHPIIGAGPNAMDTPMSYSTPLIVDSMTVYRGISPVSAGMNTLGGAIDIKMRKAEVMNAESTQVIGDLQAGYRSNNSASTLSGVTNIARDDFAVLLYGNSQSGNSMKSGDGTLIAPTDFDKLQAGFDLRHSTGVNTVGLSYHYTDTNDSGTPALPMDIEYIESHRFNLDGNFTLAQWRGEWSLGYLDADHGMTNFLMRKQKHAMNMGMAMDTGINTSHKRNTAVSDTTDFKLVIEKEFYFGELGFGVDGYSATHDSVITKPDVHAFEVLNFNNVKDEHYAVFTEWQNQFELTRVQLGVRVKHASANADEVKSSMAMPDMGGNMHADMPSMRALATDLQTGFNHTDRAVSDTHVDMALSTQTQFCDEISVYLGLGIKSRAPSYQERYLWTPMEATGGLADGHTYIGNIALRSETAYQTDLGFTWQKRDFMIAPHVFYQKIDNYIQGTPMSMADSSAKMMASMMAKDNNPLKFSNVDAKLYGADVNWYYNINESFQLSGIASYVKGVRRDISDNLYRIAPINAQVSVTYHHEVLLANLTLIAVTSQQDVSATNGEKATSGYGVVNLDAEYYINSALTLRGGVDNLFDREYRNHLGGYNRVKEVGTAVMNRLPSEGVSAWAEATYSF